MPISRATPINDSARNIHAPENGRANEMTSARFTVALGRVSRNMLRTYCSYLKAKTLQPIPELVKVDRLLVTLTRAMSTS